MKIRIGGTRLRQEDTLVTHRGTLLCTSMGIAAGLLSISRDSVACPMIAPDREAIVSAHLGAAGEVDLELDWYRNENGNRCRVFAWIPESRLPSVRVAPAPIALLEHVASVVAEWGTASCRLSVIVEPDSEESDEWWCRAGEFTYSDGRWWPVDPDSEC